ncbi:MAG TPA: hypothetical protein VME63_17880 [Dyella sp.]|uniref:hypothetical protein n=1 Tax=Dyella sp. TaxID=1869338 RepID=UPI002C90B4D6|nr:hypothetical protein [Dyella sp.]HTV87270.1 hypothetical protein [Dyella sp.]
MFVHDPASGATNRAPKAKPNHQEADAALSKLLETLRKLEQTQRSAAQKAPSRAASQRHDELAAGIACARDIIVRLKGADRDQWIMSLSKDMSCE